LRLGRYTLYDEIASGGMAAVHIGRAHGGAGFSKTVAVKRLHAQFAREPDVRAMFQDEARLSARIQHTNVVQVLDVVESGSEVFMVMEYVHGEALSTLLLMTRQRRELVPDPIIATVISGMLHGLHAAHVAKGDDGVPLNIVHRDVSPHNLLIGVDGVPRVIDFGIAMAAKRSQNTREGQLKGKLTYMSPEQLREEPVSSKTDVYAVGVMLWECLAGRKLFDSDEPVTNYMRILAGEIPRPSMLDPRVSHELEDVAMRALSLDPSARFATARDMALHIERVAQLAPAATVATWMTELAGPRLDAKLAKVAAIEKASTDSDLSIEMLADESAPVRGGPPSRRAPPAPSQRAPTSAAPRAPSSHRNVGQPSGSGGDFAPPSMRESTRRDIAEGDAALPDTPRPPSTMRRPLTMPTPAAPVQVGQAGGYGGYGGYGVDAGYPGGGAGTDGVPASGPRSTAFASVPEQLRKPETLLPNVAWMPQQGIGLPGTPAGFEAPKPVGKSSGGAWFGLVVLLIILGGGLYFAAPALFTASYQERARGVGVEMTVAATQYKWGNLHFTRMNLTSTEVPGLSLSAESVDVEIAPLSARRVTMTDAELKVAGSPKELETAINRVLMTHPALSGDGNVQEVTIKGLRVHWEQPLGPQTRLEASNVDFSAQRTAGRALGSDLKADAQVVRVLTVDAKAPLSFGPWGLTVARVADVWSTQATLDPTRSVPSSFAFAYGPEGMLTMDANVAGPLKSLGIPHGALAPFAAPETILSLNGSYRADNKQAQGKVSFMLSPLQNARGHAGTPEDLAVEWRVSDLSLQGPTRNVAGDVLLGRDKRPLSGTLQAEGGRVLLSTKSKPEPKAAQITLGIDTQKLATGAFSLEVTSSKP
jgi:serine/threonine-protein kinase